MGMNLWGVSPLYVNFVYGSDWFHILIRGDLPDGRPHIPAASDMITHRMNGRKSAEVVGCVGNLDLASSGPFLAWLHPAASTIKPTSPASSSPRWRSGQALPDEKTTRSRADVGVFRQSLVVATMQRRIEIGTGICVPRCSMAHCIRPDECLHGASLTGLSPQERSLNGSCLSAYGSTCSRNRPVRTRTPGGVGAGGGGLKTPPRLPACVPGMPGDLWVIVGI